LLSFLVSLDVFWTLRKPGLTLAGNADCGIVEHIHNELCGNDCSTEEHVHNIHCYSDDSSGVETMLYWQNLFRSYPYTGDLRKDFVGIAKTQVGYSESKDNFEVGADGKRRGYTRYGAWYGMAYSDWSATFVSFCLNYAKADLSKHPINSGAFSMMELWKKEDKFIPSGKYFPVSGDLVFFNDNTVGIVVETYNSTFYVIKGDLNDAVCGTTVLIKDPSIVGWGITGGNVIDDGISPTIKIDAKLSENKKSASPYVYKRTSTEPQISLLSARTSQGGTEIVPYLQGKGGSYFFTLLDKNNKELQTDENGNCIVIANTGYNLTLSFSAPYGISPGTYWYQLPNGLVVDSGNDDFVLSDGTNVGSWTVSDSGLITFVFNENINNRTHVTISATMGAHFAEQDELINFDGKIFVNVQKPPEESGTTVVSKYGIQGTEGDSQGRTDPNRIYWNACIVGKKNSNIPGSIITDKLIMSNWTSTHEYTPTDMAAGLEIGVTEPDGTPDGNWHSWTVYPGDPNLTWTTDGWTYKMPETIKCRWGCTVNLGNEDWIYYINYSSTPDLTEKLGYMYYQNIISVDNQYADRHVEIMGEVKGVVKKSGNFVSDANGAYFMWEINVVIPGRQKDQKPDFYWFFQDDLVIKDKDGNITGYVENTAHLSEVTVKYNGNIIKVPNVEDATENDAFAWHLSWSKSENGVYFKREICLLHRCNCDADNCHLSGGCYGPWYQDRYGDWKESKLFCHCWLSEYPAEFTFTYKTEDISLLEKYGGSGYQINNQVRLMHKINEGQSAETSTTSQQSVPIPSIMKKELTKDFDGHTANYRITINESKIVLTDGSPLHIRDEMTTTLAYIGGSMVIQAEDANGNITTLRQDVDYTLAYDGTGKEKNDQGNSIHLLKIEILNPQPVMYILDYETTLIIPSGAAGGVKYGNSAYVLMWGENLKSTSEEKVYADINIAARLYRVNLHKKSSITQEALSGAVFALCNAKDGIITTGTTDQKGDVLFQTDVEKGVVLVEHELYYVKEISAPNGYQITDTKYWFCFCSETIDSCQTCDNVMMGTKAVRIPYEKIGDVEAPNHPLYFDLPETGGIGTYPLMLVGAIFIITPLVYRFIQKRKRGRRGAG
jgi:hypothetical protein